MTALSEVEEAVRAMKLGAVEFLTKPVDEADLVALVDRSLAVRSDQLEAQAARRSRERRLAKQVVGESVSFRRLQDIVEQVALSEVGSILIQGESGSGKNVLARQVHALSPRRERPILEVSCATIPENAARERALRPREGRLHGRRRPRSAASSSWPRAARSSSTRSASCASTLQAKLLRFLEERRFRRVGGTREIQVDVRVVGRHEPGPRARWSGKARSARTSSTA